MSDRECERTRPVRAKEVARSLECVEPRHVQDDDEERAVHPVLSAWLMMKLLRGAAVTTMSPSRSPNVEGAMLREGAFLAGFWVVLMRGLLAPSHMMDRLVGVDGTQEDRWGSIGPLTEATHARCKANTERTGPGHEWDRPHLIPRNRQVTCRATADVRGESLIGECVNRPVKVSPYLSGCFS